MQHMLPAAAAAVALCARADVIVEVVACKMNA